MDMQSTPQLSQRHLNTSEIATCKYQKWKWSTHAYHIHHVYWSTLLRLGQVTQKRYHFKYVCFILQPHIWAELVTFSNRSNVGLSTMFVLNYWTVCSQKTIGCWSILHTQVFSPFVTYFRLVYKRASIHGQDILGRHNNLPKLHLINANYSKLTQQNDPYHTFVHYQF